MVRQVLRSRLWIETAKDEIKRYQKDLESSFKYQAQLDTARAKSKEIDDKLEIGQPQNAAPIEEGETVEEEAQETDEEDIEDISPMGLESKAAFPNHPSAEAIQKFLDPTQENPETLLDRLQDAIDHFEVEHPAITAALSQMLNTLSNAGI